MISPIKIILLIPFCLILLFFLFKPKEKLIIRISIILMSLIAILFVTFPDFTNRLAGVVDVGRGADLVIYLFMVLVFFALVYMYSKMRAMHNTLTDIIREISIRNSKEEEKK